MQRYNVIQCFFQQNSRKILLWFWLSLISNILILVLSVIIAQMYAHLQNSPVVDAPISAPAPDFIGVYDKFFYNFRHFPLLFILFNSILVSFFLVDTIRKKQQGILSEFFQHDIRQIVFNHHLKMSIATYEQRGMGRYLLDFDEKLTSISLFWSKGILQFGVDASLLLLGWGLILFLDSRIAFIIMGVWGVCFFVFKLLNKKIEALERKKQNLKSQMLRFFNACIWAIASIQAFNRATTEQHRFESQSLKVKKEGIYHTAWTALHENFALITLYFALGLSLFFIFHENEQNLEAFDPTSQLTIMFILMTLQRPLFRVAKIGVIWKKGLHSLDSLNLFLTKPTNNAYSIAEKKMTPSVLSIKNVAFKVNQVNVLKISKIDLPTKGIQVIDTSYTHMWIKILAGLERHTEGAILLDNTDIRQLNPRILRQQIAFASPTFPLYGDTVLESLTYGLKKEHPAQMRLILKVWCSTFPVLKTVRADTPFHENGLGLSVIQHQLLRLLNGLCTQKPFLILEEPLSALDSETTHKVWNLLTQEARTKGILIVSKNGAYYKNLLAETFKNNTIDHNP